MKPAAKRTKRANNNSNGARPRVEAVPVVKACSREHSSYELGISYKDETNPAYFDEGQQLHKAKCLGCNVTIVPKGTNVKGLVFKPTTKKPAYMCTGREHCGCLVVVCGDCFFNVASGDGVTVNSW